MSRIYRKAPLLSRYYLLAMSVIGCVLIGAVSLVRRMFHLSGPVDSALLATGALAIWLAALFALKTVARYQTRRWLENHPLGYLIRLREAFEIRHLDSEEK